MNGWDEDVYMSSFGPWFFGWHGDTLLPVCSWSGEMWINFI